jgi:hypothetical protein
MKYIKTYEAHGGTASTDDLIKFHKTLMGGVNELINLDKKWNFIGRRTQNNPTDPESSIVKVDEAIKKYILTPKFRAEVLSKYKVDIPTKIYLQYKNSRKSEYHHKWTWEMKDALLERERHFQITVEIETPIDEDFQSDNTVVTLWLHIIPNNRRKNYFEMYNRRITQDKEQNMYILIDMIQQFGEQMQQDFKIPVKLSKAKKIGNLRLDDQQQ